MIFQRSQLAVSRTVATLVPGHDNDADERKNKSREKKADYQDFLSHAVSLTKQSAIQPSNYGRPVPVSDFTRETSLALMLPLAFTSARKFAALIG